MWAHYRKLLKIVDQLLSCISQVLKCLYSLRFRKNPHADWNLPQVFIIFIFHELIMFVIMHFDYIIWYSTEVLIHFQFVWSFVAALYTTAPILVAWAVDHASFVYYAAFLWVVVVPYMWQTLNRCRLWEIPGLDVVSSVSHDLLLIFQLKFIMAILLSFLTPIVYWRQHSGIVLTAPPVKSKTVFRFPSPGGFYISLWFLLVVQNGFILLSVLVKVHGLLARQVYHLLAIASHFLWRSILIFSHSGKMLISWFRLLNIRLIGVSIINTRMSLHFLELLNPFVFRFTIWIELLQQVFWQRTLFWILILTLHPF